MKRVLSLLILILSMGLFVGCGQKEASKDLYDTIMARGNMIVGVKDDTKPFGYRNSAGELAGYDIDLAREIAKEVLGDANKIVFVPVNASNRIMMLNSSQVDMIIATMSITPQRQQIIDFSIPYHVAGQAVMVKKNSTISSLSDLNGKRVVIVLGSTAEKNIRLHASQCTVIGFKTYTEGYNALKSGQADAMVADDTILLGFAQNDNSVKLLNKRYSQEPYAVAFRKSEESKDLKDKVNIILSNMFTSGKTNRLKEKWLKY